MSLQDQSLLYLAELNEAQYEAVTQPLHSITRVVAGPGAGKTRVLACRIIHLLQNDEHESRILALTFTRKAADEMQNRVKDMLIALDPERALSPPPLEDGGTVLPHGLDRVTLGTFHSVCSKILRWNGKHLAKLPSVVEDMSTSHNETNLDGTFAILDQGDQLRIVKTLVKQYDLDGLEDSRNRPIKPLTILSCFSKLKDDKVSYESTQRNVALRTAAQIFPAYRQHLYATNSLDFDSLILRTKELLEVHEDIVEALQRRWTHVLVDEFQDTSITQLDLVKLLSRESLLVVGDADQSIYSWRGANVESMADFNKLFPDTKTVYLMENYRSTTNIVKAAQRVIEASISHSAKNLRQDMKPMRDEGIQPRIVTCANGKAEANFVVKSVLGMMEDGRLTPDNTVAVLYRSNAQSREIEESCVNNNLPYVVRGSAGAFYNRAEIKDILCFLRWLYNGRDATAMERAFKTPPRGIGDKSIEAFEGYCDEVDQMYASKDIVDRPTPFDLLRALANDEIEIIPEAPVATDYMTKRALNRLLSFSEQMNEFYERAQKLPLSDLMSYLLEMLEFQEHVDSISKSKTEFEDRWSNVLELQQAAFKYKGSTIDQIEENESPPLAEFLDDIALVTDMSEDHENEDGNEKKSLKVNLMTVHSAKGMEFDVVFVIGNEQGTFPTSQAIAEGAVQLDEERRLLYVAMTRARNQLILTWRFEVAIFTDRHGMHVIERDRSQFLDVLSSRVPKEYRSDGTGGGHGKIKGVSAVGSMMEGKDDTLRKKKKIKKKVKKTSKQRRKQKESRPLSLSEHTLMLAGLLPDKKIDKSLIPERHPMQMKEEDAVLERIDPGWIYPVGSNVIHTRFGKGRVTSSLPEEEHNEPMVRVEFEDGLVMDVPVMAGGLLPG